MVRKYAKIADEETKQVDVGLGDNSKFYKSLGMVEQDVEQAYNGFWYLLGYAPEEPSKTYSELRAAEYPDYREFLDAEVKINSSDEALIAEGETQKAKYVADCLVVKAKYPKPESEA